MSASFILILVYIGLIYVRPHEYVPALQDLPILPTVLISAVVAWLIQKNKSFEASQYWLLPVLLLIMSVSVALTGWLGGAIAAFMNFYAIVILFYVISTSTDTILKHRLFISTLAIMTTVLALHGIDQVETGVGWSGAKVIDGRITYLGFFNDPNDLALTFVVALPMLAYCLTEAKLLVSKAFWLCALAIVLYGIYLTNSRGGMLATMAIFAVYFHRRFGTLRSSILVLMGVLALLQLPSRLGDTDVDDASAAGRYDAWYSGIQMLIRRPVFGVGAYQFTDHNRLTAHNSFVLAFSELGLVGYFVWLAFIGLSVYMGYKIVVTKADQLGASGSDTEAEWSRYTKISLTYLYAMLGFFVAAFFLSRSYVISLYILCALLVALYQTVRHRWPQFAPIAIRQIAGWTFVFEIGSIAFIYVLVKVLLALGS